MSVKKQVRKERVKTLLLQGVTQREIAETLDFNVRTIERDVSEIKKEIINDIESNTTETVLGEFFLIREEVKNQVRDIYRRSSNDKTKLSALRQLQALSSEDLKICLMIGFITPKVSLEKSGLSEIIEIFQERMGINKERSS